MSDKKNKKDIGKITLTYKMEDTFNILLRAKLIERKFKNGEQIQPQLLKKFFAYFISEKTLIKQNIESKLKSVKEQTEDRFLNDKKYNFKKMLSCEWHSSFTDLTGKLIIKKEECSFPKMLDYIFNNLPINDESLYNDSKKFFLVLYDSMDNYFLKFKGKNTTNFFKHYSRQVILGFIMFKLEIILSKELRKFILGDDEPTNEQLKENVKNQYNSLKKKKAQK